MKYRRQLEDSSSYWNVVPILVLPFNPQDEMNRILRNLGYSIRLSDISDMERNGADRERVRRANEIDLARKKYVHRLQAANNSGSITNAQYQEAILGITTVPNPFQKLKKEAL